jgi:aminopeptidase N
MPEVNTTYLKDYKPPVFGIDHVELSFDLQEDHVLVENKMKMQRHFPGELHLQGDELELVNIYLNDAPLTKSDYSLQGDDLFIHNCPDEFTLTIKTKIKPQENTKLSGLYKSKQLFCTQCEAEGFRRITFFLDRPDVLTTYTTRITADKKKYPILLSNGNLIESTDLKEGRHSVVWQDPFKKPSYLFALVAGDLLCIQDTFITRSNKTIDLRIYVEPGNEDKCAHAMHSLKKAMRWDEEEFGREYDLSIFMIVAVSDFNMGAMENKGLNLFNSKYILARPETATDQDFTDIEGVIGHEYFHNWTGNRVTCRDWFQLSLKEGLTVYRDQEFSRDMNSRDVNRIQDVKVLKASQFPEDAGSMAHPVRPEAYEEISNFYTATIYNKGAEVIRMQRTLLGKQGFRKGMDLYFDRHDGHAVTIDDFVAAMEDANGVDFKQFRLWYSQAGTPLVEVSTEYKSQEFSITLKQSCAPTPESKIKKPFHIPIKIALFGPSGEIFPIPSDLLELKEAEQTFVIKNIPEKPILSLLRDFSAPIIIKQAKTQQELLALLNFEKDGFAKWDASQSLALACIFGFLKNNQHEIPLDLISAYQHILQNENLDPALKAELLMPPGFEEVIASLSLVDVAAVEETRTAYRMQLGKALYAELKAQYETLQIEEKGKMDGHAYGKRKLKNTCLWLLMKADEDVTMTICQQQYKQAQTMSDQISSFTLLAHSNKEKIRQEAAQSFYKQWAKNDLVLDKWFSVQASCDQPGTLELVKSLLQHPDFYMKNPNKVRALVGAFYQGNPKQFHAIDGSGYAFLGDMIQTLDPLNPQIASRLATPFTRWQKFDKPRQALMLGQLERLSKLSLSADLRELVSKSMKKDEP